MPTKAAREGKHVALTKCFFCGGDGCILLHRSLGDISGAHGKVCDMTPCSKCAEQMKTHVMLIGIDNAKSDSNWHQPPADPRERKGWMPNPYRTGATAFLRDAAVDRIFNDPGMNEWAKQHRWIFVEHEVISMLEKMQARAEAESAAAPESAPVPT